MDDKNELSDIVLNKGNASGSNKKIILAVATLGVVLIVVVMLMNSMNSGSTDNLPQAVLPPKPQKEVAKETTNSEPLFEEVQVMQDDSSSDADLDKIAQKLKQESAAEEKIAPVKSAPVVRKKSVKKVSKPGQKRAAVAQTATTSIKYYIQVGAFAKYKPNKKFLKSITSLGYKYKYHKVRVNSESFNKVLIGPFKTQKEANDAKRVIRAKIVPGAFLVKI